jgi:tRNA pseudouridine32 synthase/23S rRNA pseudouridine746 synthase
MMVEYHPPVDPLVVLYRDDDMVVVDKPSGLLSVPGKPETHRDCLEDRVRAEYPTTLLIHRLDLETSGVMVFALSKPAQKHINLQFERRQVQKTYIARVAGVVEQDAGEIDLPLIADWPRRPMQKVCFDTGKPARTHWRVLERETDATRLELTPETGRSHQLRVHLKEIGHPILGDPFYAEEIHYRAAPRLQLHAETLVLRHPVGGIWQEFRAECPF